MLELRMQTVVASLGALVLLLAAPAVAQTQQAAKVHRIGFVTPFSAGPSIEAFRQGLRHLGYIEGKNLVIESRYADGDFKRLPQLEGRPCTCTRF
jgi:ABC-type sugar transport system substrate-binding protein